MDTLTQIIRRLEKYDPLYEGGLPETQEQAQASDQNDTVGIEVGEGPVDTGAGVTPSWGLTDVEWVQRFDDIIARYPEALTDVQTSLRVMSSVGMTREMQQVRPPSVTQVVVNFEDAFVDDGAYILNLSSFHSSNIHLISVTVVDSEFELGDDVRALRLCLQKRSVRTQGALELVPGSTECLIRDKGHTRVDTRMYELHNASVALALFRPTPCDCLTGPGTPNDQELWLRTPTACMAMIKYCFDVDPASANDTHMELLKHDGTFFSLPVNKARAIREHIRGTCEPLDPQDLVVRVESFDGSSLPDPSTKPTLRGALSLQVSFSVTGT